MLSFVVWRRLLGMHWLLGSEFGEFRIPKIVGKICMCGRRTSDQLQWGLVWRQVPGNEAGRLGQDCGTPETPWRLEAPCRQRAGDCVLCPSFTLLFANSLTIRKVVPGAEEKKKNVIEEKWKKHFIQWLYFAYWVCGVGMGSICFLLMEHPGSSWSDSLGELLKGFKPRTRFSCVKQDPNWRNLWTLNY